MRVLLLTALAVVLSVPSIAQPVVGVRASGLFSASEFSGSYEPGGVLGVGAGVFAEVALSSAVSFVGDVGYSQGGLHDDSIPRTTVGSPEIDPSNVLEYRVRTHAITVAPALSVTLRTEDIEPSLFVGPRLDVKLSERAELGGESGSTDSFPDTAFGLAGGAGIAKGRGRLDLRASYLWGADSPIRQSAFELRLGVTL